MEPGQVTPIVLVVILGVIALLRLSGVECYTNEKVCCRTFRGLSFDMGCDAWLLTFCR